MLHSPSQKYIWAWAASITPLRSHVSLGCERAGVVVSSCCSWTSKCLMFTVALGLASLTPLCITSRTSVVSPLWRLPSVDGLELDTPVYTSCVLWGVENTKRSLFFKGDTGRTLENRRYVDFPPQNCFSRSYGNFCTDIVFPLVDGCPWVVLSLHPSFRKKQFFSVQVTPYSLAMFVPDNF